MDGREKFEADFVELAELYDDVLEAMNSIIPRFSIVDYEEFICWLATYDGRKGDAENREMTNSDNNSEANSSVGPEELISIFNTNNQIPGFFELSADIAGSSETESNQSNIAND